MTDFSIPQRMSAGAFVIIFVKTSKTLLSAVFLYALIGLFKPGKDAADTSTLLELAGLFCGCIGVALILAGAEYLTKKFYIKNGNLIFSHGVFRRESTTIPLDRIHSLRTKRGLVYRALQMRGISFDTLASKSAELELILDESDWQNLLGLIEHEERVHTSAGEEDVISDEHSSLWFSNKKLLCDALCQNHLKGFAILFGFLAMIFDRIHDVMDDAATSIANYTTEHIEESMLTPWHVIILLVIIYIVVVALWSGKTFLRYYDMSLTMTKTLLTIDRGMLSRSSSRFSLNKVCTIQVKRNFLERKFGYCTLMLKQALNATGDKEDDNLKIYGDDTSDIFLQWWLGRDYTLSAGIMTAKSGRGVLLHRALPAMFISVVAGCVLCCFHLYIWTIIPIGYALVSWIKGLYALRHSRIVLKDSYAVINNGNFADIKNYIKYGNIQVVQMRRTPFTRRFHRVTLVISTIGTTFTIRSLNEDEAKKIYEFLLQMTLDRSQKI